MVIVNDLTLYFIFSSLKLIKIRHSNHFCSNSTLAQRIAQGQYIQCSAGFLFVHFNNGCFVLPASNPMWQHALLQYHFIGALCRHGFLTPVNRPGKLR